METYNLLIPATAGKSWRKGDTLLIAFSLLPNKQGAITWSPLALDTLPAGMLRSLPEVVRDGFARVQAYDQAGKPRDHLLITQDRLLPVVRRAGRYWVPGPYVMTQYFRIRSQATSSLVQTDYVTINIKSPAVSSDAPYRTLRALFPPDVPYEWALFSPIGIVREGAYHGRYEFWSRPPWDMGHVPFSRYYGADIFEYKPGIGLLSGRYRWYFKELDWSKPNAYFDQITVDGHTQLR
ncbi:hypothetical protein [Hymenobacter sediminis]|uniref:hypothetical protein n=1 Tax=Hymenobacter sediminis TaxID=2218621 RepID=UPI000DA6A807|nr:hypothetical protein [Hymenobacter sediminis]